jgi:uncharacterized repeat protein (TIGR03803 family)
MPRRKLSAGLPLALAILTATTLTATRSVAQQENVLHSFNHVGNGGSSPAAGLISDASGNLYGTTVSGGTGSCTPVYGGGSVPCGTIFELSPRTGGGWAEKVLHNFHGKDGYSPSASLISDAAGNLYGTTFFGGTGSCAYKSGNVIGCGVVFELTPSAGGGWVEKVLHTFRNTGGFWPNAGLVFDGAGNIYGTTTQSTVFQLTPSAGGRWTEKVIYTFCSQPNCTDGIFPYASLVFDAAGNIYGTTESGGGNPFGAGTVFELTPTKGGSWAEKVLYSFCSKSSCTDGSYPYAGLVFDASGNLYGVTADGGNNTSCYNNNGNGCGTVFELTPTSAGGWSETVLHNFGAGADGAYPSGRLIFDAAGNLYGTTSSGGAFMWGTAFKLSPQAGGGWSESVLHSFDPADNDGSVPLGGLVIGASGNLYGTTENGGAYSHGTVFRIKP